MGPLDGIRVIEMVGIGPGPFVGMMLADMGAEVIAVDRKTASEAPQLKIDIHRRGKRSVIINLKSEDGKAALLDLCKSADAIFEGFRPGVMENLGVGPDVCMAQNPKLVFGRMTGWGQTGPLSAAAGHDLNYIALTGALHAIGDKDAPPPPPLNLIGDYGGAMFMAFGLVSAILNTRATGKGQVIDVAMVDAVNSLMGMFHSGMASGIWAKQRESNFLDGGAPYYCCYETSDGKYVSLGAIEYPFMKEFVARSGAPESVLQGHKNPASWPAVREELTTFFKTRTLREWCDLLEGSDACFAPVIPVWEAHEHPHNKARENFVDIEGVLQPAPCPRYSRTHAEIRRAPVTAGEDSLAIFESLGYDEARINRLMS